MTSRLELEVGTDVLLLESGDALLLQSAIDISGGGGGVLGGSFPAYRRLTKEYTKRGKLLPLNILNKHFLGADGEFHHRGELLGADGKYHPPSSFIGGDGQYHTLKRRRK